MLAKTIEGPLRDAGLVPATVIDFDTPRIWHLLMIDPSRPRVITEWLQRAKLWVYWPNFTVQVCGRKGLRRIKQVSVLHGYLPLAVHTSRADTWDVVRRTPGVRGYLPDEQGRPAPIRECEIEVIRETEGSLNLAPQQAAVAAFPVGLPVRFIDARLCAWDKATVRAVADDGRISVHVSLLGRMIPMWVEANQIEAI